MEKKVPEQPELKPLSASRLKTMENCSWLYWCNYHLKLPQEKNEGAKKGDICHDVFEVLLKKDRVAYVKKMMDAGSVAVCPSIVRLIKLYIKKYHLADTQPNFQQLDEMILVGLRSDFYVAGGVLVAPEFRFDLKSDSPKFRIKGFMDKPFIKGNEVIIDDFKSSKRKFAGEDAESNLQALFYSFASQLLWPDKEPTIRFIFLQYPEKPIMTIKFSPDTLLGFKYYLESAQLKVEGFNEFVAKGHFAYDDPKPTDGSFGGKDLCGFAAHPGKLKKDGTKMWHCPYRFGYDYYALLDKDKVVKCAFTAEELKPKAGQHIEKRHYDGCPKHRNPLDTFDPTPIRPKEAPKRYANVLEDLF